MIRKLAHCNCGRVIGSAFLLLLSTPLLAGEIENKIIDKAVAAYGGDSLLQLKQLTVTDQLTEFSQGQSGHAAQGPMSMHLNEHQVTIGIDFENNRKVFKRGTSKRVGYHGSHNLIASHRIFDDGKGYTVDHCAGQYQVANYINFDNIDAGLSQMLDPLIIRQLDQQREQSRLTDVVYIQGQAHDVLTLNEGTKQAYSVYLNQHSGLLTRMTKKQGARVRSYDFLQHQQKDGITWARQLFVSDASSPLYLTDERQISFEPLEKPDFSLPAGYQAYQQPEFFDVSELTIRELAEGVYFVGQEWSYTLFIDAGDYYISAGAWHFQPGFQAWKKALALLHKTAGNQKPVKQHLVSHHHTDHMAALAGIVAQGTDLIIHPGDIAAVNAHLKTPLDNERFIPISETAHIADGKIMLFDVPNSHASHNLVMYLSESKILFTEDMFGSSYKTEHHSPNGWPVQDTYERLAILTEKVGQMGLEVAQYVSSHHGRILNQAEIDQANNMSCVAVDKLQQRLFH